ncbi:hypothetical protein K449DRAFT_397725 [Hypoxylon sp. EC38]|nr:hypothetical protein K449DRAFT_397725 [Hypoxylon sp. EC38]
MNGAKDATDQSAVSGQTENPTSSNAIPLMAGANGNGTSSPTTSNLASPTLLNKKRKKDGLKPIITTEGPAPGRVFFTFLFSMPSVYTPVLPTAYAHHLAAHNIIVGLHGFGVQIYRKQASKK